VDIRWFQQPHRLLLLLLLLLLPLGDIINKNVVAAYWLKCDITLSQFCRNKTPLPRQQSKWKN
jgi:hypothetical protein